MISGFDVSYYQHPDKWNWTALKNDSSEVQFMIARASYGRGTKDTAFVQYAHFIRDYGLVFGAYHFYRQIHSVEDQLTIFDEQLEAVGGLEAGDLFPVLDMEHNGVNGDGRPRAKHFSESCRRIAETWRQQYGGCILYYSSYFPEWLDIHRDPSITQWMGEQGYYHWLADYDREPGNPRTPYTPRTVLGEVAWHIHQPRPKKSEFYSMNVVVDRDYIHPSLELEKLIIGDRMKPSDEAVKCEHDTDERPGGAMRLELETSIQKMKDGIDGIREGLDGLLVKGFSEVDEEE